jgi:hypothetical protein
MIYFKPITLNIGDHVEVLTNDGWESGVVIDLTPDSITVLPEYKLKAITVTINFIR